jgi:hypothetical protein
VPRSAGAPILAAVLLLVATACAGDDPTRVTLTNDDCTYEGPDSVDAGTVALDIENESDEVGVFELVRMEPPSAEDDLEAYVIAEQERIDAGDAPLGTPGFVTSVVPRLEVEPGEVSHLTAGLTAAGYAVLCATGTPPTSIHATESFEAT